MPVKMFYLKQFRYSQLKKQKAFAFLLAFSSLETITKKTA